VALLITWQTRRVTAELMHNLAVDFWITANCMWMVGEFFQWDENLVGAWGLRQFALVPFAIGLLILFYYYLILAPRSKFREDTANQEEEIIKSELERP